MDDRSRRRPRPAGDSSDGFTGNDDSGDDDVGDVGEDDLGDVGEDDLGDVGEDDLGDVGEDDLGDVGFGQATADTDATVACPHCGESVVIGVDPGGGPDQRYVEDCEVCCRAWQVTVTFDARGRVAVHLDALEA